MWKSLPEVEAALAQSRSDGGLADLWALHHFIEDTVFSPSYPTDETWSDIVVLAPAGQRLLELCTDVVAPFSRADVHLALFGLFYYHDVLIDTERTDFTRALARINNEFRAGLLRWPYLFGRVLYDRFNDTAQARHVDHIEAAEAQALLDGTPAGVYQVGTLLCGPYGVIRSAERRYVPPTNHLPLWHCSDTGCGAIHRVFLTPPAVPVVQAYNRIQNFALEVLGPRSEWRRPLDRLAAGSLTQTATQFFDVPVLIGNAVIGAERTALVAAALRTPRASHIRALISSGGSLVGAPEAVAAQLAEEHQLQLLLTLTNSELQQLIDTCVLDGRIEVPINEIRTAGFAPPRLRNRERPSELSSLGVRTRPRVPLALLHTTIWDTYEGLGLLEELGWKLRRTPSAPTAGALMEFIQASEPARVITDLVLSSMPVTRALADKLSIPIEVMDRIPHATDIVLWKLGFDPARFPNEYERLRARIDDFTATVLSIPEARSEEAREKIRAVGVNLFVSVEHVLEELVSYNTWLLSFDHFLGKFTYRYRDALAAVPSVLGARIPSGTVNVQWSTDGDNSLGTLVTYAQRMVGWMADLRTRDRGTVKRSEEDLPHYADDPEQSFVFGHTELWADANAGELERFIDGLNTIVGHVNRADLSTIRNGLDHKRDERSFPRADGMLACAARLREAFDAADAKRYLPKLLWLRSMTTDRVGRQQFVFSDYRGKQITIGGPPVVSGLPKPGFRTAIIVPAGNLLGEPNAELQFRVRAHSAYAGYWANYPRRRRIPSPRQAHHEDDQVASTG